MKKYIFLTISIFTLTVFSACAPTAAYQAQGSLKDASREASCQAAQTKKEQASLNQDSYQMKGDIQRIKEAERLFDAKSGIVLSY